MEPPNLADDLSLSDPPFPPLDRNKREIRLIKLSPSFVKATSRTRSNSKGRWPKIMQFRSQTYSLDALKTSDEIWFNAISYTWGSPVRKKPVELNGTIVQISENLEAALRHFTSRQEVETLLFWADALCIDQGSKVEKSWQVRLMREIYESAFWVQIWLGEGDEQSEGAIDQLRAIAKEIPSVGSIEEWVQQREDGRLNSPIAPNAIAEIFSKPWWGRVWIIQELLVAKTPVFQCGRNMIGGHQLLGAYFALLELQNSIRNKYYQKSPPSCPLPFRHEPCVRNNTDIMENLTETGVELLGMNLTMGCKASHLINTNRLFRGFREKWSGDHVAAKLMLSLPEFLFRTSYNGSEAGNPSDMIFPFLGLASDAPDFGLSADYTVSVQQIYIDTAMVFLQKGFVRILGLCQHPKRIDDLPSWVPDWTKELEKPLCSRSSDDELAFGTPSLYSASRGDWAPKFLPLGRHPRFLSLSALVFDKVSVPGDLPRPYIASGDAMETWTPFQNSFSKLCEKHGAAYKSEEQKLDVLWRTPIGDVFSQNASIPGKWQRATPDAIKGHRELILNVACDWNTFFDSTSALGLNYHLCTRFIVPKLRPFATKKGYIGMGPLTIQEGDIVAIIIGLEAPTILRKSDDDKYEIVGEAYVHGIMDGEAMDAQDVMIGKIVLK